MTILLDSHAFVWWVLDDKQLSSRAFSAIEQDPDVYLSVVVAWEVSTKVRAGKWPTAKPLSDRFVEAMIHYNLRPLAISVEHASFAGSMPGAHRDPFDRMLAAQAITEGLPLVTVDPAFQHFGVQVIW